MDQPAPPNCARCSEEITEPQLVYFDRSNLIHVRCLRLSTELNRVARQFLDEAQAAQRQRTKPDADLGAQPQ